jgi:uncharacterized membrane protein YkvA (DUF1232 family)
MSKFDADAVARALDLKVERLRPEDVQRVAANGAAVQALIDELPRELERSRQQARLLFGFLSANADAVSGPRFSAVAQAAGALLYLSSPLDLVPDTEDDGYADDVAILELAVERIRPALEKFCREHGWEAGAAL